MEVLAFSFSAENIGSILLAAFGLGLVIFIHELGHFAVAKWCGVKVERFSIGFGPALWKRTRGETEYVIAALPLGGYVKMLGQDDADPGQMTDQQVAKDPRSYTAKSVPQRIAIISAGVINNMVSAVLFFIIAFMLGVKYQPASIGGVTPGMPAWKAGLRLGDEITQINDRTEKLSFTDVRLAVALSRKDEQIKIAGYRDGKSFTTTVDPIVIEKQLVPTIFAEPESSLTLPDVKHEAAGAGITRRGMSASRANPPFEPGDEIQELNGVALKRYVDLALGLARHRSETVEFGVRRKGAPQDAPLTRVSVEPNHFHTLGLKMAIGKITAIQNGSPADGKLHPGDLITNIVAPDAKAVGVDIDPLQLPDYFASHAGSEVRILVKREAPGGNPTSKEISLIPEDRPGWVERPTPLKDCPLSVPAIGVAFHVLHHVMDVTAGGPAARAGIKKDDNLQSITFELPKGADPDGYEKTSFTLEFGEDERNWPFAFWQLQDLVHRKITLSVKTQGSEKLVNVEVTPEQDAHWYLPMRGLSMQQHFQIRKAQNIGEAASLGFRRTRDSLIEMRLTIEGLFSRRISVRALGGPIRIAETAFFFSQQGIPDLILFLGILSVSLAVLNFLPIPVLDGGHFVFLCWEGIRGKPPSERVVVTATYVGLAFILSLMAFVMYIDISSLVGGK
ncbi:MAG: RIP metalloprotease RseP [Planctomycetia bacterium]|nr:RIP metalloprotease RseP [Planctomycetia bacterium]